MRVFVLTSLFISFSAVSVAGGLSSPKAALLKLQDIGKRAILRSSVSTEGKVSVKREKFNKLLASLGVATFLLTSQIAHSEIMDGSVQKHMEVNSGFDDTRTSMILYFGGGDSRVSYDGGVIGIPSYYSQIHGDGREQFGDTHTFGFGMRGYHGLRELSLIFYKDTAGATEDKMKVGNVIVTGDYKRGYNWMLSFDGKILGMKGEPPFLASPFVYSPLSMHLGVYYKRFTHLSYAPIGDENIPLAEQTLFSRQTQRLSNVGLYLKANLDLFNIDENHRVGLSAMISEESKRLDGGGGVDRLFFMYVKRGY